MAEGIIGDPLAGHLDDAVGASQDIERAAADAADAPAGEQAQPANPLGDALGGITTALERVVGRIEALEQRYADAAKPPPPAAPAAPAEFDFNNPLGSVQRTAEAAATQAVERFGSQLAPFLETVAKGLTEGGIANARAIFDDQLAPGAFDRLIADDLRSALDRLPPGQRADAGYVQAIASGVLGGKVLSPEGRKELNTIMAAKRPAPPVVLTGSRAAPQPGKLSDDERDLVDRIRKSGVPFDEKQYLASRDRARSEDAWGATWHLPPSMQKPNGRGA